MNLFLCFLPVFCVLKKKQVIHGPSSALKELLENALDANSTQIQILVKDGGKRMLQITDNGHGIREEDLEIVCERHTTSKLRTFEDLETVGTFGFRGEALASITYVANVMIQTMCKDQKHAMKATYTDGKMDEGSKAACAGVQGTIICAENLFYNVPARRNALKSASEEYAKILDVVTRYAVSRPDVAFSCRKQGDTRATLNAPITTTAAAITVEGEIVEDHEQQKEDFHKEEKLRSRLERIGQTYGPSVAKELLPLKLRTNNDKLEKNAPQFHLECDMFYSGANYKAKKTTFILFINERLVECSSLKRAIESAYQTVLPKAERPFVFLSMKLPCKDIDVNVHPTKKEVHFLHQEEIIERVQSALEKALIKNNASRTFTVQTLLPGVEKMKRNGGDDQIKALEEGEDDVEDDDEDSVPIIATNEKKIKTTQREKAGGDHKLVRTNPTKNMASLDAFYRKTTTAPPLEVATPLAEGERGASEAMLSRRTSTALLEEVRRNVRARRNRPTKEGGAMNDVAPYYTDLTSVLEICELIREQKHEQISEMLHSHTVVGPADVASGKWLIQHRTKLLMINVNAASRQLMYQLVFAKFNGFKSIAISPPARLCDLCEMSSSSATKSVNDAADADAKKKFFERVVEVLLPRATMLKEYFGITIEKIVSSSSNDNESTKGEEDVVISTLPEILDGHSPDLSRLPEFVDSLCSKVDWSTEKRCFETIAQSLADFYGVLDDDIQREQEQQRQLPASETNEKLESQLWQTRHVIFPALGSTAFLAPKSFATDGSVAEVACLEQLYKVFERC